MSDPVILADKAKIYSELVLLTDKDDGVHVRADGAEIVSCQIRDLRSADRQQALEHCDAVQLIPPGGSVRRGWYAGAMLSGVTVQNCMVNATGSQLQGVSGFDGLFSKLRILDNTIINDSVHKITVCGMLSGEVRGNVDGDGDVIPAVLYPWKVGGGRKGEPSVWVIGFAAGCSVDYLDVSGDVLDKRRVVFNDSDVFLDQFDADAFWAVADSVYDRDAEAHGDALRELALTFGELVGRGRLPEANNKPAQAGGLVVSKNARKIFDPLTELGLVQAQDVTVGILFNNPMAVKAYERWEHDLERSEWPDFMRNRREDLLRFDHPSWGIRCAVWILLKYQARGLSTIRQMISTWAPCKGKDADNSCESTNAYIQHVSRKVGVGPDELVGLKKDYRLAYAMVTAMIEHENGWSMPYDRETIDNGLALAGIPMERESGVVVKPEANSSERKGAILIGGGGIGGIITKGLQEYGVSEEEAAVVVNEAGEVIRKVNDSAATIDWMFWLTLLNTAFFLAIIAGAVWFWRGRDLAGKLGLR